MKPENALSLPNLFIGGAPKCGTTSLTIYLRTHPNVFVCEPKEPTYWATDMPGLRADLGFATMERYASLFNSAQSSHRYLADGSTMYLYSDNALKDIYARIPDAKFVFAIRNPVEVAHAYHMQMIFYEQDDQMDFEAAWRMQDARAAGELPVPKRCLSPKLLQYRYVAALGSQLEKLFLLIPKDRVHLVLMDDLKADAAKVYSEMLQFLELPHDGRTEFGKENAAMRTRSKVITRLMRTRLIRRVSWWGKQNLSGWLHSCAKRMKNGITFENAPRTPMSVQFKRELTAFFAPEVESIEGVFGRDLSAWKSV